MSSSVGIIIPNIWKNKIHVPNHQPGIIQLGFLILLHVFWSLRWCFNSSLKPIFYAVWQSNTVTRPYYIIIYVYIYIYIISNLYKQKDTLGTTKSINNRIKPSTPLEVGAIIWICRKKKPQIWWSLRVIISPIKIEI